MRKTLTTLALTVVTLLGLGIVLLATASAVRAQGLYADPHYFFKRQLLWLALSVAVVFLVSRFDYHWWKETPLLTVGFYLFVVNDFGWPTITRVTATVAGLTLGYYAPNLYSSTVAQKRRESIVGAFPDALDLLLICVESGMSVEAAIHKVSQEIGGASIELAEEMSLLTAELSYLPDRRQAYEGMARRTNHPGIKSVTTAMIQAERYGTPLGAALRVMAKENREMRISAAEKKAAQLPAKLTIPMIVFFLPVLFIVILGPAALKVSDLMRAGGG